jgi:hypothetical protein
MRASAACVCFPPTVPEAFSPTRIFIAIFTLRFIFDLHTFVETASERGGKKELDGKGSDWL